MSDKHPHGLRIEDTEKEDMKGCMLRCCLLYIVLVVDGLIISCLELKW
jgi:hypothetical protein